MNILPQKKYYKSILTLALPAIAGLSTQMIFSIVDTAIVGRLTEAKEALAAMGIGVLMTWALVSFFSSLSTGTQVLTARKYGTHKYDECGNTLINSIYLSFVLGILVACFAVFAARPFAFFYAKDHLVGKLTGDFLFFRFIGIPFFLIGVAYRGFFFGINKTKVFMVAVLVTNILNIIFNYILVFGKLGLPQMGVAGSGLGSTLATSCEFFIYLIVSLSPAYRKKYNFKNLSFHKDIIRSIFKISLPVSFQNVFILIGFLSFIGIVGLIGVKEQAASQIVITSLFLSILPCFGFGIAVQTLVGNNLGSGKINIAKIYGYETAKLATYYTLLLGLVYILFPQLILNIITEDKSIIMEAVPALRIAGFAQIFYATGVVLANGLQAGGKTLFVMTAEVISNLFIFVPFAYLLGIVFHLGLRGAWGALPIYIIIYSSIIFMKFRKEKFTHKFESEK